MFGLELCWDLDTVTIALDQLGGRLTSLGSRLSPSVSMLYLSLYSVFLLCPSIKLYNFLLKGLAHSLLDLFLGTFYRLWELWGEVWILLSSVTEELRDPSQVPERAQCSASL